MQERQAVNNGLLVIIPLEKDGYLPFFLLDRVLVERAPLKAS